MAPPSPPRFQPLSPSHLHLLPERLRRWPGGDRSGAAGLEGGLAKSPAKATSCLTASERGRAPGDSHRGWSWPIQVTETWQSGIWRRAIPSPAPPSALLFHPPLPTTTTTLPCKFHSPAGEASVRGHLGGRGKGERLGRGASLQTTRPRLRPRRQQGGKGSGAGSVPVTPGVRSCSLSSQDKSGVTPPRAVAHNELTPLLLGGSPGGHGQTGWMHEATWSWGQPRRPPST